MDADEAGRVLDSAASDVIGSVEVLEPKIALSPITACDLRDHVGLDLAVLEHRLDDEVASFERAVVGGRRDARKQRIAVGALSRPFITWSDIALCRPALPLSAVS